MVLSEFFEKLVVGLIDLLGLYAIQQKIKNINDFVCIVTVIEVGHQIEYIPQNPAYFLKFLLTPVSHYANPFADGASNNETFDYPNRCIGLFLPISSLFFQAICHRSHYTHNVFVRDGLKFG